MTAPMDLSDDELRVYDIVKDGDMQMSIELRRTFQKLSDARAALRVNDGLIDALEAAFSRLESICDEASYTEDGQAMYVDPARIYEARDASDDVIRARKEVATPAPVAVPAAPVDDVGRCAICAWPLAKDGLVSQGCVRGNCAFRGDPPIHPTQRYAPARAEIESAALRASVKP